MSESVSGVSGKQCDEVEERKEIFDNTEVDEEDEVCNSSSVGSFISDSEGAALTFHAENVNDSSSVRDVDLSKVIQPQACLNHLMYQELNWNPERGLGHLHLQVNKLRVRS